VQKESVSLPAYRCSNRFMSAANECERQIGIIGIMYDSTLVAHVLYVKRRRIRETVVSDYSRNADWEALWLLSTNVYIVTVSNEDVPCSLKVPCR
jgi:hypothetical protein